MVRVSLNEKLVLSFVLIGTFAILLVTSATFYYQKKALLDRTFDQLTSLRNVKQGILNHYLDDKVEDFKTFLNSNGINDLTENFDTNKVIHVIENFLAANHKYEDLKFKYEIKNSILDKIAKGSSVFINEYINPDSSESFIVFSSPIFNKYDSCLGMFELYLSTKHINEFIFEDDEKSGIGNTGETYIVGKDNFMRTKSRFVENSYLKTKVETKAIVDALHDTIGTGIFKDYRNEDVLSSFGLFEYSDLKWILIAEIDYKEAMIPIQNSRGTIMFLGIIMMTITFLVAFLIAKTISAPIVNLKNATIDIAEGNFDIELRRNTNDEIGELTDTFNKMIFQLKKQNKELLNREERLNHFYNATKDGIVLHKNMLPVLFNQAILKLGNYTEDEFKILNLESLISNYPKLNSVKDSEEILAYESILITKDHHQIPVEIQESQIEYNGEVINATVIREISKRKAVENALKLERRKRIRAVIDGQDFERQRLSRELHDGLGQNLIATKLKLEIAKEDNCNKTEEAIKEIEEEFDTIIDEVRRISNNLMPAALEQFGIGAALRFISENMAENKDIQVDYKAEGEFSLLTNRTKIYLFRICQEALNNVVKHSEATKVSISLIQKEDMAVLEVEDNGKGFNLKNSQTYSTNGLYNMRERVNLLQGSLEVFSEIGKGSTIKVSIPLDNL